MKRVIFALPLFLFLALVVLFMVGLEHDPRLIPSPFIGKPAPPLSLPRLIKDDQMLSRDDLIGEVMLVNFWATWCPTCKGEHAVLMEIADTNEVAIYGIDYKDDQIAATAWLERLGNPYRAVGFDKEGNAAIDWGVYGTPETFVLDKDGIIRYKHVGAISWQDWKETLEPLVKQLQEE